ncbi:MAG: YIP1 family protein [Ignavibacteriales bacterium]|nr:MAG: YIP1 family protein [Ignavibacteriales bacterium]
MNLIDRAKNILITPKTEWEVIKNENLTTAEMYTGYAVILAAIPAAASFIGNSLIGVSVPFTSINFKYPIGSGLIYAVLYYILSLVSVYVVALVMDALAPSFGASKNFNASLKVTIFSSTAAWIAGIFSILPVLSILSILGLYSLYLLYLGMKTLKDSPADKLVGYYVVLLLIMIVIYVVIGIVVGAIAFAGYDLPRMM